MYAYVAGFRIAKLRTVPKPFSWPHVSENISLGLWPGTCVKCGQTITIFAGEINLSYPSIEVKSDHPPCWEICPDMASDQLWRHKSRVKQSFSTAAVGLCLHFWPMTHIFFTRLSVLAPCVFSLCLFWTFPPNMSGQLHMVFHCHKILKTPGFQIRNSIYYYYSTQ